MNITEFQQKISETGKPIVIDFWADWCVPCKMTKPTLEKLGVEYAEKVTFIPINADDSQEILDQFHVASIPTVITFRDGKEVGRLIGAQKEADYRAMFETLSTGNEDVIRTSITQRDRMLRLGAGVLIMIDGFSIKNWIVFGVGAIIAFLGVYDRCPVWKALTQKFKRN